MESDDPGEGTTSETEGRTEVQDTLIDNPANKTQFRNLYIPTIEFPDDNVPDEENSQRRKKSPITEPLNDTTAAKYGDTTRVGWKGRVDYAISAYEAQRLKAQATEHEVQRDPAALLNVTVTTVMLLASGIYDIPIEYYMYTELYLLSIRDEFNDSPPNIESLIKHIRFIRRNNNIRWENEVFDEPPPGLVISKIPNQSRIPLPIHSHTPSRTTSASTKPITSSQGLEAAAEPTG